MTARGDSLGYSRNPGSNYYAGFTHQLMIDLDSDDAAKVSAFHSLWVGKASRPPGPRPRGPAQPSPALLFDEFHERSLDADLGLALARDVQQALREDLKLLVMSATIDGARIAAHLTDAPVIASEGRAFPVETRYLGRDPGRPIGPQVVDAVLRALRAELGSLLVFLPGAAEIRRVERMLGDSLRDPATDIVALYGTLDAEQHGDSVIF